MKAKLSAYCIGIGGIGVSAIAKLLTIQGWRVTGSDLTPSRITSELEKLKIKIFWKSEAENIPADCELVIYSPAVPDDNPELVEARKRGLKIYSYPEYLGFLSQYKKTIAIAGTNGKSTTTAMVGKIWRDALRAPTVILGSLVPEFRGNALLGNGEDFIVEACEYKANMLNIQPQTIVLTNIEEDHLDFYKDLDDIIHHFQKFLNSLPIQQGCLVMNEDDAASKKLVTSKGYQVITFGLSDQADFRATEVKIEKHRQVFTVWHNGEKLGQITLRLPGHYNVMNALAAIAVSVIHGISWEVIAKSLGSFKGIWRRFELVGRMTSSRALVVSDYAHHPTAVKETLLAAKQFYPRARLMVVFQPHHIDRTIKLFDEFVTSLTPAPVLIVNEIYQVAGREEESLAKMSSEKLVAEIKKRSAQDKPIFFTPDLEATYNEIEKIAKPKDVILIMGAGDIDKVARKLVNPNTNL